MTRHDIAAVILAAGRGTRMRSDMPKVLHPLACRPMVLHVLDSVARLQPTRMVVVIGPEMDAVKPVVAPHPVAIQERQCGTADAAKAARHALAGFSDGTVLIVFGDTPLVRTETLSEMIACREAGAAVVVLGFHPENPTGYGRLIHDQGGALAAIVEDLDLNESQRSVSLCNSGVMAVDAAHLMALLDAVSNDNAKREYYLTDIVAIAHGLGLGCAVVEAEPAELVGVDSRADLASVEAYWQQTRRARAMAEGATLLAPETVWFSHDTVFGRDVVVGPNVQFGPGVTLGDRVEVKAFCHLEGARIENDSTIGPFARLRPGAEIGAGSRIGNFVEVKNAVLGEGVRAGHLAYLGDAQIGPNANIGAGTVTCNYDGVDKHRTVIGAGAFIGTNAALVAPLTVGNGAFVAAGSVVTDDVSDDALVIARGRQAELAGRAAQMREASDKKPEGDKKPAKARGTKAGQRKRRKIG
jgi:bifunctional UDP-N-acetylglucosamine pyrophosphorylase/glucosamine-1-phosphate N-acetyltransferase